MPRLGRCLLALALAAPLALPDAAPAQTTGLQNQVVFTDYSPLSSNTELVRRLLSPLAVSQIRGAAAPVMG